MRTCHRSTKVSIVIVLSSVLTILTGDFQHGLQHGEGKLVYPNGSQYVGAWEADQMHGYGVLRDAEGGVAHQGRFERGLFVEAVEVPMFRNKRGLGADDQLEVGLCRRHAVINLCGYLF